MSMTQTCRQCQSSFAITDQDLAFYEKVSPVFNGKKYAVPTPTLCPDCRQQRRLAFRNERSLYHRKCGLCGQQIISIYASDKPYKVYCPKCYYSDRWDALNYGREFDFNKPFFEQFKELQLTAPMLSINLQKENENCDYTNLTTRNKNCYLIFAATTNEDCYYCTYLHRSKNVVDCFFIFDSELCYECIDCYFSYNLGYSQNCQQCRDSYFLYSCQGCNNCFGCVNLSHKQYCLFNQQYSKAGYEQKLRGILQDPREGLMNGRNQFEKLKLTLPHKHYAGNKNESFSGDHISFSKNADQCFDCNYLEDCRFCTWLHESKNCYDCYAWGQTGELGYENHLCGNNFYQVMGCDSCWNDVSNLLYCRYCLHNCHNLFGCISLLRKEYCVLNKQYTKEEYEALVPKLILHMIKNNEWGEFFSMGLSAFDYNETLAQEYFALYKDQAIRLGANWHEREMSSEYIGPVVKIPDRISEVSDDILKQILGCKTCHKKHKIIPQALRFYRQMNVPIPKQCFNCRYMKRFRLRNPRKLFDRTCGKCGKAIKTTYAPGRPEVVYCEECYLKEVY